jgi:hypothetical protein
LVRVAHLKDPALAGERHALLCHLGLEVVDAQHSKLVPRHSFFQISGDFG